MRVDGRWHQFDDGDDRPVVEAEVQSAGGVWVRVVFLLDGGADRTVFDASFRSVLAPLALPGGSSPLLAGVGGRTNALFVPTTVRFRRDDGAPVVVRGDFGVFT